ncbi:hypothetical protein [Clostridium yunnanense]|uniref:hypothetical protein n=1 Tax=Clostridium yunnanense TaxID=2800325 RepID=UPI003B84B311
MLNTYFKLELKRTLFSWRTIISALIIMALLVIPYLKEFVIPYKGIRFPYLNPNLDGVQFYINASMVSYVGYIAPVVTALIYSTSIIKDKRSGFLEKLLKIIDIKTYFKAKVAINSLMTFLVFAFSHGIVMLYFIIVYGLKQTSEKGMYNGAFEGIYDSSKLLYILIILLVLTISAVAFSIFMLGITTATDSRVMAYLFPAFYVVLTGVIFQALSLNVVVNFNITYLFNLIIDNSARGYSVIVYDFVLVILGIALLYQFGYKRTLKLYSEQ